MPVLSDHKTRDTTFSLFRAAGVALGTSRPSAGCSDIGITLNVNGRHFHRRPPGPEPEPAAESSGEMLMEEMGNLEAQNAARVSELLTANA